MTRRGGIAFAAVVFDFAGAVTARRRHYSNPRRRTYPQEHTVPGGHIPDPAAVLDESGIGLPAMAC